MPAVSQCVSKLRFRSTPACEFAHGGGQPPSGAWSSSTFLRCQALDVDEVPSFSMPFSVSWIPSLLNCGTTQISELSSNEVIWASVPYPSTSWVR